MAKARYGREIWGRAWKDWKSANLVWLVRTIALGLVVGPVLARRSAGPGVKLFDLFVGALGGGGAALLWSLFAFIVELFRAPGKLLAERDARLEEFRAEIAQFKENNGPSAEFWADLSVEGPTMKVVPKSEVFAQWDDTPKSRITIDRGRKNYVLVSYKADVVAKKKWVFPYIWQGRPLTAKSVFGWGFFGAPPKPSAEEENVVKIVLHSEPEMRGGSVSRKVRFRADEAVQV
jgi:hypothetical protein